MRFSFFFSLSICLSVSADPKEIVPLHDGLPNIDFGRIYDLASPEYRQLALCSRVPNAANCTGFPPRFYQLSSLPEASEPLAQVNRCLVVLPERMLATGLIELDAAARTVECKPGPEQIVVANVLVCYPQVAPVMGVFCGLSSLCFQGSGMNGKCTKDYRAEVVQIPPVPVVPVLGCDVAAGGTGCATKACSCATLPAKNSVKAYAAACEGTSVCHSSCDPANPMIKWQCAYSP